MVCAGLDASPLRQEGTTSSSLWKWSRRRLRSEDAPSGPAPPPTVGAEQPKFWWTGEDYNYWDAGALCNLYGGHLAVLASAQELDTPSLPKEVRGPYEVPEAVLLLTRIFQLAHGCPSLHGHFSSLHIPGRTCTHAHFPTLRRLHCRCPTGLGFSMQLSCLG